MGRGINDFDQKAEVIISKLAYYEGELDYYDLKDEVPEEEQKKIFKSNLSVNFPNALLELANENIVKIYHLEKDITSELTIKSTPAREKVRDSKIKLNYSNEYVKKVIEKLGCLKVPSGIKKSDYEFTVSADILAPRLGSIGAMWNKTIVAEKTGYRVWLCIEPTVSGEINFFYLDNGEIIPIPRLTDLVKKNLSNVELPDGTYFNKYLENFKVHFYSEVPYNSGFLTSSAISTLSSVGLQYLEGGLRDELNDNKCITSNKSIRKDKKRMFENSIEIINNLYTTKKALPATTSTCAEYLLLFGKQASTFGYKSNHYADEGQKIKPEVTYYSFPKPLFTDLWTGPGHDFPKILNSLEMRLKRLGLGSDFFEKVAENLDWSVNNLGLKGLNMIKDGLTEDEEGNIENGFNLFKEALYEQICHSLRFTYRYFSYPHIADLTRILGENKKYGSPVGAGGGGFFQLLNENFEEDTNLINRLYQVCDEWCTNDAGIGRKNFPYVLPKKEKVFWGIFVHNVDV